MSSLVAAVTVVVMVVVTVVANVEGIRFMMNKEECLSYKVEEAGSTVWFSFVVVKVETSANFNLHGVDLVVKGPKGEYIQEFPDQVSSKSDFVATNEGYYKFCFINKSTYLETIAFDVHSTPLHNHHEHVKDDHFKPILEKISKLEYALSIIQSEQYWLEGETERQAIIKEGMSSRAMHKAMVESATLIGAGVLQVYLLVRLFKRKLGSLRV